MLTASMAFSGSVFIDHFSVCAQSFIFDRLVVENGLNEKGWRG